MKIIYKTSGDYMYEDIELFNEKGESICSFNTQADCGEDNNLSRMGVLGSIQSILKELTGKEAEVIEEEY